MNETIYAGETGLDGTTLLPPPPPLPSASFGANVEPPAETNAIRAMRSALLAQDPGTPWLVATGALTNVALLFATFPEVVGHIAGLSVMGGAVGGGFTDAGLGHVRGEQGGRVGNVTRWAEFNVYVCEFFWL